MTCCVSKNGFEPNLKTGRPLHKKGLTCGDGQMQTLQTAGLLYILLPVVQIPRRTPKLRGYPWRSSLLPSS
ncbi:hypothetical protein, partial [Streptomyces sp. NPDC058254]|uniref:hypothetical protein n=1 Tax=Streptomyces sp. NPDC058254 TaxID=3346406 RepID=UPI0036EB9354